MSNYVEAPRIQVVLVPSEATKELYELWLVLHVPDESPNTIRLHGQRLFRRDEAVKAVLDIYTTLGEQFAIEHMGKAADTMQ